MIATSEKLMNSTTGGVLYLLKAALKVAGDGRKEGGVKWVARSRKITLKQNDFAMRKQDDIMYGLAVEKAFYLACFWLFM